MAGGALKRTLLDPLLTPIIRPLTRFTVQFLAIPLFRLIRRRVPGLTVVDDELEKDIEEWFRGSLLLLAATKNFEVWGANFFSLHFDYTINEQNWFLIAGRLLLAIAVIESMPDQELFTIIHPGPPPFHYDRAKSAWTNLKLQAWPITRGMLCQHLSRSSAVFAIIAVILGSTVGWICYGLAIIQYLIIGLVTSKDKAIGVLAEFDRQVALRRQELIDEFEIGKDAGPTSEAAQTEPTENQ